MAKKSTTNRRQFLAAATTGGVALLAGCSSSGNNSSNDTPTPALTTVSEPTRFVNARLTGPAQVTVGEPFRLTLHVTNIGSETSTLSQTIRVTEGSSSYSLSIDQTVESGERITVQTDPIQFDIADIYTLSVGISEISHTVAVRAKTGTVGTAFNLNDTLKATVKDIEFRPAARYSPSASDQTRLLNPPSNELLAIIRVSLENVGTQSSSVAPGTFQLAGGEVYRTLGGWGIPLNAAKIKGKPLADLQLSPAEQRTGWVLAHIPRSKAQKTVTVLYQRDGPGTPPEIKWNAKPKQGTRALPQFSVKSFRLPNTATLGQDTNATVAISNGGTKTRTFRGMIQYRTGNSGEWYAVQPITARIRAGETVQRRFTVNSSSNGRVTYRLAPLGTTETIEYVPPTLAFGETYTTTQNVKLTLSKLRETDSLRVNTWGDATERLTPPSGERFVLVHINSVVVGPSQGTPFMNEFSIRRGTDIIEEEPARSITGTRLLKPIEAPTYDGAFDPNEGKIYSGYLGFTVPRQIPLGKVTVQWTSSEPSTGAEGETARWTKTRR